jgi:hypothetical protein
MNPMFRKLQARLRKLLRGKHVLWLVDDEQRWHTYIAKTYSANPQFEVRTFTCPRAAMEALDEGSMPDLILVDIFYTSDKNELETHSMSNALEAIADQADSIWTEYQRLYEPDGLVFAQKLYEDGIPYCLYSAKGAAFMGSSSELGRRLQQTLRHSDFIIKRPYDSFHEIDQILRLIGEAKALRRQRWTRIKIVVWAVISAAFSAWVSAHWTDIGQWLTTAVQWIF